MLYHLEPFKKTPSDKLFEVEPIAFKDAKQIPEAVALRTFANKEDQRKTAAKDYFLAWIGEGLFVGVGERSNQEVKALPPLTGDILICAEDELYGVVSVVSKRSINAGKIVDLRILLTRLKREKFGEVSFDLPSP